MNPALLTRILTFLIGAEDFLETAGKTIKVATKIAEEVGKFAMYGPAYYALKMSQGIKSYYEDSDMFKTLGLDLGSRYDTPFGSVMYWKEIQNSINRTNMQMGIGGKLSGQIRDNLIESRFSMVGMGIDSENFLNSYSTFVEEYGRPFAPSDLEMKSMGLINKAFGGELDKLMPTFKLYGRSIEDTRDIISETLFEADKYGISAKKVLKDVEKNINLIDKYTFKGGLDGLKKMSVEATRLNLNMQSVAQFADRIYNPEDAIEMAASLQMMGGEFAKFGDVFQLMYDANNDVGALTEKIGDLTKGMGMLNKETGEIEFTSLERRQLKYFSDVSGIPVEEMMQSRRVQKQEEIVRRYVTPDLAKNLGPDLDKYLNKIAMLSEFKGGVPKITIGNETKLISQISKEDLDKISTVGLDPFKDPLENLVDINRSALDKMEATTEQIKIASNDITTLQAEQRALQAVNNNILMSMENGLIEAGIIGARKAKISAAENVVENSGMLAKVQEYSVSQLGAMYYGTVIGGLAGGFKLKTIFDDANSLFKKEQEKELMNRKPTTVTTQSSFSNINEILNTETKKQDLINNLLKGSGVKESNLSVSTANGTQIIEYKVNGQVYNVYDAFKDPKFVQAIKQQQPEVADYILDKYNNGGKNVGPLNPPR